MILSTFKSYVPCKLWLKKYAIKRENFINGLDGSTPPGISYEEQLGGSSRTEGEKKAIISDEIDKFDKRHRKEVRHCNEVVQLCNYWLSIIELKNRKLFELAFMRETITQEGLAKKVGYDRSWIRRRINEGIEQLEIDLE